MVLVDRYLRWSIVACRVHTGQKNGVPTIPGFVKPACQRCLPINLWIRVSAHLATFASDQCWFCDQQLDLTHRMSTRATMGSLVARVLPKAQKHRHRRGFLMSMTAHWQRSGSANEIELRAPTPLPARSLFIKLTRRMLKGNIARRIITHSSDTLQATIQYHGVHRNLQYSKVPRDTSNQTRILRERTHLSACLLARAFEDIRRDPPHQSQSDQARLSAAGFG